MYTGLLYTHSSLRYILLILLLAVIAKSFLGYSGKKPFDKTDDMLGLSLFAVTHTQLLLGLLLYFTSSFVQFSGAGMKDPEVRYWTTEHIFIMIIAITMITLARVTAKRLKDDALKHKRIFIFNLFALVLILMAIGMSKRGFFSLPESLN